MKKKVKNLYVDGFVLTVKKDKLKDYKKMAELGGKVWKKHGAISYVETIIDDAFPDMGGMKVTRFPNMTKAKEDEVVVFSYIEFESKKHRDQVNAKVMKDAMMNDPKYKDMPMPFDMKKMAYGGFKTIVSE